jgi:DNA-binding CsgD family transcriptional regulator
MTEGMLAAGFLSVMGAASKGEFQREVVRFAQDLGFAYASAMTVIDHSPTVSEFVSVDNAPSAYHEVFNNSSVGRRDPVMQHCRKETVPILWTRKTYERGGAAELWEEQAAFGYRTGVALAMHFPEGRHFTLGVEREDALPADSSELSRVVADLQLFAVYAQDAAMRLFLPRAREAELPRLTPRELEALRWTMAGKTAWEVGAIMRISERTAVSHLQNATQKLGAINKNQAVVKAMRLGLIH